MIMRTTASSTDVNDAIAGTAIRGRPRPVIPFITEPNVIAASTTTSSQMLIEPISKRTCLNFESLREA